MLLTALYLSFLSTHAFCYFVYLNDICCK